MIIMEIILNFAGGTRSREEGKEKGEEDETEEERREKEMGYDIQRMRGTGKGQQMKGSREEGSKGIERECWPLLYPCEECLRG